MKVADLGTLYFLVGAGCLLTYLVRARDLRERWIDGVLLLVVWPLYGPFLLAGDRRSSQATFLEALDRAQGTPLSLLLPDRDTAHRLMERVNDAQRRISELDDLLSRPEFSEKEASARRAVLEERGDRRAASFAQSRTENIRRLGKLRDRLDRELDEARELLDQLRVQAEIVRIAGTREIESDSLITELKACIQALDGLLGEEPRIGNGL